MGRDGRVSFVPSPKNSKSGVSGVETTRVSASRLAAAACSKADNTTGMGTSKTAAPTAVHSSSSSAASRLISCSFLRVADLGLDHQTTSFTRTDSLSSSEDAGEGPNAANPDNGSAANEPNFHHAAVNPPPGVDIDPKERWIALTTDPDGSHAPIAPIAMDRLSDFGLTTSLNEQMWVPDSKTERLLKGRGAATTTAALPDWMKATFRPGKIRLDPRRSIGEDDSEVLVWSGSFKHGLYGSDLPAIRAAGIVHMPARALMELLVDSARVQEYNKLSLGRQDLLTFDGDLQTPGPFGTSITKVMKSETRPPMIRKSLVFVSILHAKELVDGSGYLIVTRAVHRPEEEKSMANAIKSEILMGVNLIRKIDFGGGDDGDSNMCLLINVNHIRSPLVPMMVAKRIGVTSAVGFMNDIRALC
jgi:hypothetical protein